MKLAALMEIPRKGGMLVYIDPHKTVYETVEQFTFDRRIDEWVSEEQKQKSMAEDRLVEVQWYPDTPVGFYSVAGADIEAVVGHVLDGMKDGTYA